MTKIAKIEASAHSRPFEGGVLRNALGANVKRDFVLVKVTADDGTVGYGEAHHGQNLTAMAEIVRNGIGTLLVGADPFDTEGIWQRVRYQTDPDPRPRSGEASSPCPGSTSPCGTSRASCSGSRSIGSLAVRPGGSAPTWVGLTLGFQPPDALAAGGRAVRGPGLHRGQAPGRRHSEARCRAGRPRPARARGKGSTSR